MSENKNGQMVMDIDFTNVQEPESNFTEKVKPGVHDFTISGMEFGTSKNGNPYMEVTFLSGDATHKDSFYLTPKALPRLQHLLRAAGVAESILTSRATTAQIKAASVGRQFHGLLGGREFINKENGISIAAEFGFRGFAQPMSEECTLVFNASKHIQRVQDANTSTTASAGPSDGMSAPTGLPF